MTLLPNDHQVTSTLRLLSKWQSMHFSWQAWNGSWTWQCFPQTLNKASVSTCVSPAPLLPCSQTKIWKALQLILLKKSQEKVSILKILITSVILPTKKAAWPYILNIACWHYKIRQQSDENAINKHSLTQHRSQMPESGGRISLDVQAFTEALLHVWRCGVLLKHVSQFIVGVVGDAGCREHARRKWPKITKESQQKLPTPHWTHSVRGTTCFILLTKSFLFYTHNKFKCIKFQE